MVSVVRLVISWKQHKNHWQASVVSGCSPPLWVTSIAGQVRLLGENNSHSASAVSWSTELPPPRTQSSCCVGKDPPYAWKCSDHQSLLTVWCTCYWNRIPSGKAPELYNLNNSGCGQMVGNNSILPHPKWKTLTKVNDLATSWITIISEACGPLRGHGGLSPLISLWGGTLLRVLSWWTDSAKLVVKTNPVRLNEHPLRMPMHQNE